MNDANIEMSVDRSLHKLLSLVVATATFVLALPANAALINRGGGMIYDDALNITWMADAGLAKSQIGPEINWHDAQQWASNLVYGGYSDWRLPSMDVNGDGDVVDCRPSTVTESECRDNEYDYMWTINQISVASPGDFENIGSLHYWSGTENPVFPSLANLLNFETGFRGSTSKDTVNRNAWAVRDGDVAAIPLPGAMGLFGFGLLSLFSMVSRRTINKR